MKSNALFLACSFFVSLMVLGLVLKGWAANHGGPEDDPVHGTYVRPLKTQMLVDHRDEWRTALDKAYAEDGDLSWNSEHQRRYDWINDAWPYATPEIEAKVKAWRQTYDEWYFERDKALWIEQGVPLPSIYR